MSGTAPSLTTQDLQSSKSGGDVVEAFTHYFATITDAAKRARLLSKVKMSAAAMAPEEAFGQAALAAVGRSAADLIHETPEEPDWLIPGVVARGWMVKFAAREKTGKGTLIAYLLGRLERGEATVFGAAAAPTSALIYTEEPPESIREKVKRAGLDRAWIVYGWELAGLSWEEKCARLVATARERAAGIVFVDNISRAAGVEDGHVGRSGVAEFRGGSGVVGGAGHRGLRDSSVESNRSMKGAPR